MANPRQIANLNGLSALVVDDDVDMGRLIEALLRDMGAEIVDRAKDGSQAIDKLRQHVNRYNLIVSDWEMPGISGLDLLREVRKRYPDLPFLMLTVRTGTEEILAAKDARVTAYITKPFRPRDLQAKILTMTGRIAPAQETVTIC